MKALSLACGKERVEQHLEALKDFEETHDGDKLRWPLKEIQGVLE